jgi:tryptophanyl-tRNA synthetase
MSLQDGKKKMSKSDTSRLSCINLIDDPEIIRMKIRKAKTDSEGTISYDPENRPELANLLRIYSALANIDVHKSP